MKNENILKGGTNAEDVILINGVVHRSKGPNPELSQAVLKHLEKHNFSFAPRLLGIDHQDRLMLSFIEGEVPRGEVLSEQQIIDSIKILRAFHDINSLSPLCKNQETICHNDFAPWNVVFNNEQPVGIIDFDELAPGQRIDDVAYFIWTFLDFGVSTVSEDELIKQIGVLCNVYQLQDKGKLCDAFLKQQNRILQFRKDIVSNEADESKKAFSRGAVKRINASIQWVQTKGHLINFNL